MKRARRTSFAARSGARARRAAGALAFAAAAAVTTVAVRAADRVYVGTSGNWSDALNWAPAGQPDAGDNAMIVGAQPLVPLSVSYDANATTGSLGALYLDGLAAGASASFTQSAQTLSLTQEYVGYSRAATLNLNGGTHVLTGAGTNALYVGYNLGASGTVNLSSGQLTVGETIFVGFGGNGTFNQTGGIHSVNGFLAVGGSTDSTNTNASGSYNLSGGYLSANNLYVGLSGTGMLTQSGAATSQNVGNLTIANYANSTGTFILTGGSVFTANSQAVGLAGHGNFIQNGVGTENMLGVLTVADNAGSVGSYSLSAGSLDVLITEVLARTGNATFIQTGGTHNSFQLFMGIDATSSASYSLGTGGTLNVQGDSYGNGGNEYVGYYGQAQFTQTGGSHIVQRNLALGAQWGATGTMTLSGGSLSVGGSETIGQGGTGSLTQTGGAHSAGSLVLGDSGSGSLTLSGGSLLSGFYAIIGNNGTGTFTQTGGSHMVYDLDLGNYKTGIGTYALSNAASSLTVTDNEYVGYIGKGTFAQTGGTHSIAKSLLLGMQGGNGTFTLSGGSLSVGGNVVVAASTGSTATFNMTGGTLTAAGFSGPYLQTGGTASVTTLGVSGSVLPNSATVGRRGSSTSAVLTVSSFAQGAVTINFAGALHVTQKSAGGGVTNTANALIINGGILDMANNDLRVHYGTGASPVGTIAGYVRSGYANGTWLGPGINSSALAAKAAAGNHAMSLGYADGADGIVSGLASGDVLVKYTTTGDANLDGLTNFADFQIVAAHMGKTGLTHGWDVGDFNHDGRVDLTDLLMLARNLNNSVPADQAATVAAFVEASGGSLPEPGALSLALLAAPLMARRRRRARSAYRRVL